MAKASIGCLAILVLCLPVHAASDVTVVRQAYLHLVYQYRHTILGQLSATDVRCVRFTQGNHTDGDGATWRCLQLIVSTPQPQVYFMRPRRVQCESIAESHREGSEHLYPLVEKCLPRDVPAAWAYQVLSPAPTDVDKTVVLLYNIDNVGGAVQWFTSIYNIKPNWTTSPPHFLCRL